MMRLFKCSCSKGLWDGSTSFPLVKDAPVYPTLKEALRLLSSALESGQLHHGCC
ncbi:unnamed protein product [Arctogadus glacialis]